MPTMGCLKTVFMLVMARPTAAIDIVSSIWPARTMFARLQTKLSSVETMLGITWRKYVLRSLTKEGYSDGSGV